MYLYDLQSDELTCASCSSFGGIAIATLLPRITAGNDNEYPAARPRWLSDDGQVFFSTETDLVPEDGNGTFDVYEFDGRTGALNLVSSGRGRERSMFADAGTNGDDVFFVTRQALVGSDPDTVFDLYDARSGGGFQEPELAPAPCGGEACQGPTSAGPKDAAIGSSALHGAGNLKGKRCGRKARKIIRNGTPRCLKRHSRHRRKHAAQKGGAR